MLGRPPLFWGTGIRFYTPFLPDALSTESSRNITAAIPMTTMTVKKSLNVCSASIPVSRTDCASVLLTVELISERTIAPTDTMIARDTTASASGPRSSTPRIAIF